jgi:hypothetical protein
MTETVRTQVTVPADGPLIGSRLDAAKIPFGASVVAIKRGNGRQDGPLRDVVLAPGDILLLDTGWCSGETMNTNGVHLCCRAVLPGYVRYSFLII